MATRVPNPPPGFDDMSIGEQVAYVGSLWERIVAREHEIAVPPSHMAELQTRLAEHVASPDEVVTWNDVERELEDDRAQRQRR